MSELRIKSRPDCAREKKKHERNERFREKRNEKDIGERKRTSKRKKKEGEKKRGSIPRVLVGRLGGGKFNFDPVDSAVIPKFNL